MKGMNWRLAALLALPFVSLLPGQSRYDLVVAAGRVPDPLRHPAPPSRELLITPRSTAQVYLYLANGVEVPPEHVGAGGVCPGLSGLPATAGLLAIHTAATHKPPPGVYLAVKYRGWWDGMELFHNVR